MAGMVHAARVMGEYHWMLLEVPPKRASSKYFTYVGFVSPKCLFWGKSVP
jgi:hypothetical protein